jgi:membrane protease subunit HflC
MNALGLKIEAVGIKTFILPEKITEKVFERMKAERNVLSEKYRSSGKSEAKSMRDEADNKRKSMLAEAELKAKIIKSEGDDLATKYYSAFTENPELAAFLRKLESLNRIKAGKITLILNSEKYPFDIMNEVK